MLGIFHKRRAGILQDTPVTVNHAVGRNLRVESARPLRNGLAMRPAAALLLPLLLSGLFFTGCASSASGPGEKTTPSTSAEDKPQYGGVFASTRLSSDPPSFDIHRESAIDVITSTSANYGLIVRYAPLEEKVVPDLAERWEYSSDGKTVTFYLRKGVKFHNGDDLTSADVKFTLDRVRGAIAQGPGALAAPRKELLQAVDRVETPDDYTVILRLLYPSANLLNWVASPTNAVYDKKWVEAGHEPTKEVNGTGAFKFKEYIRGTSFELVKNDKYWNPELPYLEGVKSYIIPDTGTALAALKTGQLMIGSIDEAQEPTVRPQIESGELAATLRLVTTRQAGPVALVWLYNSRAPFNDVRVRQAVNLALDRQEILRSKGTPRVGAVVFGWTLPGSYWALPAEELAKIPGYGSDKAADRAQAKKLLADAGYPNGLNIKTFSRNQQSSIDTVILYGAQLKTIGINVDLQPVDVSVVNDRQRAHDFDLLIQRANAGTTEDPDTFFNQFYLCNAPRNYQVFCNPKFEDLNARQSQTLDPEARRKIVWEIEKYVLGEVVPVLPDSSLTPVLTAINKKVRGWAPHPSAGSYPAYRFDTVWLAK